MTQNNAISLSKVILRGTFQRCPCCGQGKLFSSYLKQVESCSVCSEKLGHIRADDGPAWLTVLLVGHIVAPLMLSILPTLTWPDWIIIAVVIGITLLLALTLLPRSKGIFIGLIWRSRCLGSEK